jgi:CxxC motif-containing protein (DUF1111 family)
MRRYRLLSVLILPFPVGLASCDGGSSGAGQVTPGTRAPPGGPVAGLTQDELAAFERGRAVFLRRFGPSAGLGPHYNATSCESCHSSPTVGGSAQLYRNFYLAMWFDGFRQVPLPDLPSAVVPAFGNGITFRLDGGRMVMPPEVNGSPLIVAQRNSLPLFGVGLFEFVRDATILAMTDPDDLDGDGISGRHNTDNGAIGRFGVKAQSNNVEVFTRAPLKNQLGVTSDPFLGAGAVVSLGAPLARQVSTDPSLPTSDIDGVPDPEITRDDLGDLIAFTRFLAPPERVLPMSAAAERGEVLFADLGCVECHVPELPTSRFGTIQPFTDLLLHELGPELADGLAFGRPQTSSLSLPTAAAEFRTQPLWGVSLSGPFLHDGRAETLREAIELHGGEAAAIRDAFVSSSPADQADLIEFLEHL